MDPAVAALVLTGPAEADPPSAVCRASTPPVVTSRACHRGSLSRLPSLSCAAPRCCHRCCRRAHRPPLPCAALKVRRRRCRGASCRPPPAAIVPCAHCCAPASSHPPSGADATALRQLSCAAPWSQRSRLPPLPASEWDRRGEEVREYKDEKFWNVVEGKRGGNLDFRF